MQYLKEDSELGYIEDYTEIELEKLENLRSSINSFAFGDYDENGDYVIEDEVVDDLIAIEKYIVESDGNMEYCKSSLKLDKQISFVISYEGNKIYLLLVEKLKDKTNPKIEEFNEYVLDEYIVNGLVDRNIVYAKWNVKPFGGYVLDIFNCEDEVLEKYFGIVSRFRYLLESNKFLVEEEEEIEDVEAEYFNDMLELLKRYPKLYDAVILKMREFIDSHEDLFDETKPWYISHINQLLNFCINSNLQLLTNVEKVEFEIDKHQLIIGQSVKKTALIPTSKKDNGALFLKTTENLKTIAEIGSAYVEAVKKINKILKPENQSQSEKKTFTKKEMAIIKMEKAGLKKIKDKLKEKSTIVNNIVKSISDSAKKTAAKGGGKKTVAKAAAKGGGGKTAAKGGGKGSGGGGKATAKKKTAKKAAANNKTKEAAAKKKKAEEERKRRLRYAYSTGAAIVMNIQPNLISRVSGVYSNQTTQQTVIQQMTKPAQAQNQSFRPDQTNNPQQQQQSAGNGSNGSGNTSTTNRVVVTTNRFTTQQFQDMYGENNRVIKAGRRGASTGGLNPYEQQNEQNARVGGQERGVGDFGQPNKNQEHDINV